MYCHQHFNLRLHGDDELAALLGDKVGERVTLHEWPLSCVQRLTTAGGRRVIYKSQFGPTVEPDFYAVACSDLLVPARTVYCSDGHTCMLIDFIDAPRLLDLHLPVEEVVRIGRAVMAQVAQMGGGLPYIVDARGQKAWGKLVAGVLADLDMLREQGQLNRVTQEVLYLLEQWAFSRSVLSALDTETGYVHRDLGGDNLFLLPDGYRVIDWQRPMLGPIELDLATLLDSLGHDPWPYVDEGIVRIMYLLRIHWLSQCAVRWFPAGVAGYDAAITELVAALDGPKSPAVKP
jgi:hypothetical protein